MNRRIAKLIKIGLFALPLAWTGVSFAQGANDYSTGTAGTKVPSDTGANPMPKDNVPLDFDSSSGRTSAQKKAGQIDNTPNLGTVDQGDIGRTSGSDVNKDTDLYKKDVTPKSSTDQLKEPEFNKTGGSDVNKDLNKDTSKSTDVNKGNLDTGSTDIQKQSGSDIEQKSDIQQQSGADTNLGDDTSMNKTDESDLKGTTSTKKHHKARKSSTIRKSESKTLKSDTSKEVMPNSDTDLGQ